MNTYYLDSTSWINLAKSEQSRDCVLQAIEKNNIRVKAGWTVLDETVNEGQKNPSNYSTFLVDFWRIVGGRILLPVNLRMAMEFLKSEPLPEQDMYVSYIGQDGIVGFFNDRLVKEAIDDVRKQKADGLNRLSKDRDKASDYCREKGLTPSSPEWTQMESNFPAFAREYASNFWSKAVDQRKFEELPTYSSFFLCGLERLRLMAKEGRSAKRLSYFDQLVYVDARSSGCDFLVTDDKGLTEIAVNLQRRLSSGPTAISHANFIDFISKS